MSKNNDNNTSNFNDKLAMFMGKQNNPIKSEKTQKLEEKNKKEKNNPIIEKQNKIKNDKKEEDKKEPNKVANFINQLNKKEELKTENKTDIKKEIQSSKKISVKENITPLNKDKKEKKENNNKKNEINDLNSSKGKSNESFKEKINVFQKNNTEKEENKNNNMKKEISQNILKNILNEDKKPYGEIRTTSTVMIRSNLKIDKINEKKKDKPANSNSNAVSNKTNNFQQRIKDMEKKNIDDKNKPKEIKNHIDQSILERLKLFYNPEKSANTQPSNSSKEINKEKVDINNNNSDKKNENNKNINDDIKKEKEKEKEKVTPKEKEMSTFQLASKKIAMHISEIKNIDKNDASSLQKIPKKLNLNEYFKKLKIEEISSTIKEDKRAEIIKFAQKNKDEEKIKVEPEPEKEQEQEQETEQAQENDQENDQYMYEDFTILTLDNSLNNSIPKDENELKNESNEKTKKKKKKGSLYKKISHIVKDKICNSLFKKSDSKDISDKNESSSNMQIVDETPEDDNLNTSANFSSFSNYDNNYTNMRLNSTINQPIKPKDKGFDKNEFDIDKTTSRITLQYSKSSNVFTNQKRIEIPKENIFLEMVNVSKNDTKKKDETNSKNNFCESFFIASFPTENGTIVENTENDRADCGHEDCFKLPAMQPEIIYKYPKEDIKGLELNNIAASICFPNGIKICYAEEENSIKTVKNYRSAFTSQAGDIYFALTYHFYYKMLNQDFSTIYKMNPIRYQLTTYTDELTTTFNDELFEKTKEKFNFYSNLVFRENVYIPFCLCLVSKYPFYEQMEKCLESIMISLINNKTTIEELHQLITYIIESIPAPPKESKISFGLPYVQKICEIQYPYFENILQIGDNPIILLKNKFRVSLIIYVFKLLILEQKILVIGKDNDAVSQFIINIVSLLYPFEWIHTYIPVMSEKMLKFLQSFLPFFNGMNISLYEKAKPILAKATKGVFIVNIDERTIEINTNLRDNAKPTKVTNYINKCFENLPGNIGRLLYKGLKAIQIEYDNLQNHNNIWTTSINIKIKHLFLHVFAKLIHDYKKYSHIIDGYPVFNSFLMIKEKKEDKNFYREFLSTQLFQMFVQTSFDDKEKNFYFDEYIKEYNELKKEGNNSSTVFYRQSLSFSDKYNSFLQIKKNYVIKPYFFKGFDEVEKKNEKSHQNYKIKEVFKFISNQKQPNIDFYNGILKENQRFVDHPFDFNNNNDPKSYIKFIIPEEKKENNNNKESKDTSQMTLDDFKTNIRGSSKVRIISGEDKNRFSICFRNRGNSLTEDEMDEIKDNVREVMTRVYKSELTNIEEDKKKIMDIFTQTKFGRDHFINVISSGNKKERVVKILRRDSYDFMYYVIFNSLLKMVIEQNEENTKYAINLLKTCLYIKTVDNKKELLLSDELFSRLENYSLFTQIDFWKLWIEDDMTESDIEVLRLVRQSKEDRNSDNYKKYSDHSYDIMDRLCSTMIKMKLKNDFIYMTFTELCKLYIFDDDIFNKVMQEFINELYFYKKLTNQ